MAIPLFALKCIAR